SGDPAAAGLFAFDGRDDTAWLGESGRRAATLVWRWQGRARTIDRIRIVAAAQPSVRPATAVIRSGGEERRVRLDGLGTFEPLRADGRIRIDFEAPEGAGEFRELPLGMAEVVL